ncbi:MAG: hypothetical protein Q9221_008848 [Calogaya cf. arnoldii]
MYAGLGFSAVIFVIHGIFLHGWVLQNQRMSIDWMALMATFNLVGATTYAARVPEKFRPYKYDIFGSSHQILHVAVILAGLAHIGSVLLAHALLRPRRSLECLLPQKARVNRLSDESDTGSFAPVVSPTRACTKRLRDTVKQAVAMMK